MMNDSLFTDEPYPTGATAVAEPGESLFTDVPYPSADGELFTEEAFPTPAPAAPKPTAPASASPRVPQARQYDEIDAYQDVMDMMGLAGGPPTERENKEQQYFQGQLEAYRQYYRDSPQDNLAVRAAMAPVYDIGSTLKAFYYDAIKGDHDEANRVMLSRAAQRAALSEFDKDALVGETLAGWTTGVTGSVGSMAYGALAGTAVGNPIGGVLATAAYQSGAGARAEALADGATEREANIVGLANAAVEAGVTMAFGAAGRAGLEKVASEGLRGMGKGGLRQIARNIGDELAEENIIEQLSLGIDGVVRGEWATPEEMARVAFDTTGQTLLTMGLVSGSAKVTDFVANPSRKNAKAVGLEQLKTQAERQEYADAVKQGAAEQKIDAYSAVVERLRQASPEFAAAEQADPGTPEFETLADHNDAVYARYAATGHTFGDAELDAVMPAIIALHDIGKPAAVQRGDRRLQKAYTLPMLRPVMEAAGFNDRQIQFATEFISQDIVGETVQRLKDWKEAELEMSAIAGRLKLPRTNFLDAAKAFYYADAGSYAKLQTKIFDEGGNIRDTEYRILEEAIYGNVQGLSWAADYRGRNGGPRGADAAERVVYKHVSGRDFTQFDPSKDTGKNLAGPGAYLLPPGHEQAAPGYAKRLIESSLALLEENARNKLRAIIDSGDVNRIKPYRDLAIRKQAEGKNAEAWAKIADLMALLIDYGQDAVVMEFEFEPKNILDLGARATGGRMLSEAEIGSLLDAARAIAPDAEAPVVNSKRAWRVYEKIQKSVGYARANEVVAAAGYDAIGFIHSGHNAFKTPKHAVVVAIDHAAPKRRPSGKMPAVEASPAPNRFQQPQDRPEGRYGLLGAQTAYNTTATQVQDVTGGQGPTLGLPDVIKSIEAIASSLGEVTPIRSGLRGKRGDVIGFYDPAAAVVRLESRADFMTAAHEVGHVAAYAMGIRHEADLERAVGQAAFSEMEQEGMRLYGQNQPKNGYANEGFAQYMRYYVMDGPNTAGRLFPAFHTAFMQLLSPQVKAAMDNATAAVKQWGDQGALRRAQAEVVDPASLRRRWKKWKESKPLTRLYNGIRDFIEEYAPLKDFDAAFIEGGGRLRGRRMSSYKIAKSLRSRSRGILDSMVEKAMVDGGGNIVGNSLKQELSMLKPGDSNLFQVYLTLLRGRALYNAAVPLSEKPSAGSQTQVIEAARGTPLSAEDTQYAIDVIETQHPDFVKAADGFYRWWDGVLDYLGDVSPEFEKRVIDQREDNLQRFGTTHGNYVPLHRDIDYATLQNAVRTGTPISSAALSGALRGSEKAVKLPLDQAVAKAGVLIERAHHRRVLDVMFAQYAQAWRDPNNRKLGPWIEPIPEAKVPLNIPLDRMIEEIKGMLTRVGVGPNVADVTVDTVRNTLTNVGLAVDNALLTVYQKSGKPINDRGERPIFAREVNGELEFFRVDPRLYNAISRIPDPDIAAWRRATQIVALTTRAARAGAITLNPAFLLITSPMREFRTFMYHAEGDMVRNVKDWLAAAFQGYAAVLSDAANVATFGLTPKFHYKWLDLVERLGITQATMLMQDTRKTRGTVRYASGERGVGIAVGKAWNHLLDIMSQMDMVPRIAAIQEKARQLGWDPSQPLTREISEQLALAGKEITADFSAGSQGSRLANSLLMFFTAQLQGPRATVRAARRDPVEFGKRLMVMTAVGVGYWMLNKDEEWWKQRNKTDDLRYWKFLFSGNPDTGEVFRVPLNQEADLIPASLIAVLDAWYQNEPEAAVQYAGDLFEFLTPQLPVPLQFLREQWRNMQDYNDSPIVPPYIEQAAIPEEEKYSTYTSETAKAIGRVLNLSPARIEHAVKTFAGGAGLGTFKLLDQAAGVAKGSNKPYELADTPLVGRLWQRGGALGTRPKAVNDLFLTLKDAEGRAIRNQETEKQRYARLQLIDATKEIAAYLGMRSLADTREQQRELTNIATDRARQALQDFADGRAGELRREAYATKRKAAERRLELEERRKTPTPAR